MGTINVEAFNTLIADEDFDAVLSLFDEDASEVRRLLTRLTYTPGSPLHVGAIKMFRHLSGQRSGDNPVFFTEIIRRHLWGMNDEGGNIDWGAPEIIAAVIAGNPERFGQFVPYLYNAAVTESLFHESLLAALQMLDAQDPKLAQPYLLELEALLSDGSKT